jgi:hypothetical protein
VQTKAKLSDKAKTTIKAHIKNKKMIEQDDGEIVNIQDVRDSSNSVGRPLKLSKLSVHLNEHP